MGLNLKELTRENHTNAERQQFVKVMFGGSIEPKLYARYLWNQFPQYEILELMAAQHGMVMSQDWICRNVAAS